MGIQSDGQRLNKMGPSSNIDIQKLSAKLSSLSSENVRLKKDNQSLRRKSLSDERRLTFKMSTLAVTEPVDDSRGVKHHVPIQEILESDMYRALRPLVGPLMEASVRVIQGSDLSRPIPLKEIGDDGKPTKRPLLDESGKPIMAPATIQQVQNFYSELLQDEKVLECLSSINQVIQKYTPEFKAMAPEFKGVHEPYVTSKEQYLQDLETLRTRKTRRNINRGPSGPEIDF